jgi:SAM-dependent methyltransferase
LKTSQTIRDFYDRLYRHPEKENPAYNLYDQLRAGTIGQLARGCSGSVLIVGCGSRRDLSIVTGLSPLFGFDLSFEAVHSIAGGKNLLAADALDIPFPAGHFNLVICSEVLEHIPDIHRAVKELRRVMKPDGILIVSSPNWISWFGLARWLSKTVLGRDITSNEQPYDDWKTFSRYAAELSPEFKVTSSRGVWYLPPMHYRKTGLPEWLVRAIYLLYSPMETFLSRFMPKTGHLLILKCIPSTSGSG